MDKEITTPVAAELIGCTDSMVRRLLRDGILTGRRIGRDWIVERASAETYRDRPAGKGRPRNRPQPLPKRKRKDSP